MKGCLKFKYMTKIVLIRFLGKSVLPQTLKGA
jgi:hypothetical protein